MKPIHVDSDGDAVITTNEELQEYMSEFKCFTEKELQKRFWCTFGVALVINIK
jgi:hypothetical protein